MTRGRFAVGALVVLAACKTEPVAIEALPTSITKALCGAAAKCGEYPDADTCEATIGLRYDDLTNGVRAGRVLYDAQAAAYCVKELEAGMGVASCSLTAQLSANELPDCRKAISGTIAVGLSCTSDLECASRSCHRPDCAADAACCRGTCAALYAVGNDCDIPGAVCETGTRCVADPSQGTALCVRKAASGETCFGSDGCLPGSLCLVPAGADRGTCGHLPGHGQPCAPGDEPACDATSDTCAMNTCVPRVGMGGACPTGVECVLYARCHLPTHTCVPKLAAGMACAASSDCLGALACTDGLCAPPVAPPACL